MRTDGDHEGDEEDGLPDRRGDREREQGQRPEGDRKERRVGVRTGCAWDGIQVEREAGVQARPRVVVQPGVGERVGGHVEHKRLQAQGCPDHGSEDRHPAQPFPAGLRQRECSMGGHDLGASFRFPEPDGGQQDHPRVDPDHRKGQPDGNRDEPTPARHAPEGHEKAGDHQSQHEQLAPAR